MHMYRFLRSLGISLTLLGIAGFIVYYVTQEPALVWDKKAENASITTPVPIGGPFRLIDSQGTVRTDQEFRGKYLLIYFGYTFCPDMCPMALSNISEAIPLLGRDRDQIVPIFITIDPERDTQEALQAYGSHFQSNIVMLTGTRMQLEPVMKAYRAYGVKAEDNNKTTDYLMDHSTLIYLMDRQGRFLRFFPHTTSGRELADGIVAVLLAER